MAPNSAYRPNKNVEWNLPTNLDGRITWDAVKIALLMDIRGELQILNRVFACHRFQDVPNKLDQIEKNTRRKKKSKRSPRAT